MKLSVIIPVYNEKATISEILRRVREVPLEKEMIVVDGCSTDGTRETLQIEEKKTSDLCVIYETAREGKGAAVRKAFARVQGDVWVIQDADLELDPSFYPSLLAPLQEDRADIVYGSRFMEGRGQTPLIPYLGNRALTALANLLYDSHLTDIETGFKMGRRRLLELFALSVNGFGFDTEITAQALAHGIRIAEVPVHYNPRSHREGKKIPRLRIGLQAVWILLVTRIKNLFR